MLTVTTPATDYTLLTQAEVQAALGEAGTGVSPADLITLEKRVAAAITKACKVPADGAQKPTLRLETLTETFRLRSSQDALVLSRRPTVEVVSITENDDAALTAATDYENHAAAGLIRRLSGDTEICWSSGKIVAVYRAGWATVPDDLKAIAAELVQTFWSERDKSDSNLRSEEVPGVLAQSWWVDNTDTAPLPEKLMSRLRQGGYVNIWVG